MIPMIFYATPFPVHILFPLTEGDPLGLAKVFDLYQYPGAGTFNEPRILAEDRQFIESLAKVTPYPFSATAGVPQVKDIQPIIEDDVAYRNTPLMFIEGTKLFSVQGTPEHTTEDAPWVITDDQMDQFRQMYLDHLKERNPDDFVLPIHVY